MSKKQDSETSFNENHSDNISVKSKGRKPKLPFEKIKLKKLGGGHRQKEEQYDTERIL